MSRKSNEEIVRGVFEDEARDQYVQDRTAGLFGRGARLEGNEIKFGGGDDDPPSGGSDGETPVWILSKVLGAEMDLGGFMHLADYSKDAKYRMVQQLETYAGAAIYGSVMGPEMAEIKSPEVLNTVLSLVPNKLQNQLEKLGSSAGAQQVAHAVREGNLAGIRQVQAENPLELITYVIKQATSELEKGTATPKDCKAIVRRIGACIEGAPNEELRMYYAGIARSWNGYDDLIQVLDGAKVEMPAEGIFDLSISEPLIPQTPIRHNKATDWLKRQVADTSYSRLNAMLKPQPAAQH